MRVDWPARLAPVQLSPTHAIFYVNIADVRQEIEYCKFVYELSTYSNIGRLIFDIVLFAQSDNAMSIVYLVPFVGLIRPYAVHFYRSFELYERHGTLAQL